MAKKEVKDLFNKQADANIAHLSHMKPTQLTVGLLEVEVKQKILREKAKDPAKLKKFLEENPIIVVRGPEDTIYVVDHHHLSLALLKEGYTTAPINVVQDFSQCTQAEFWQKMQEKQLVYLGDENGATKTLADLPAGLDGLKDDIYRSLAWFVRTDGGYNKVKTPYAEFAWANYFRSKMDKPFVTDNFDEARKLGVMLAKSPEVKDLPGAVAEPQPGTFSAFKLKHHRK